MAPIPDTGWLGRPTRPPFRPNSPLTADRGIGLRWEAWLRSQASGTTKIKTPAGTPTEPVEGIGQVGTLDALLTALLHVSRAIDAATTWLGKRLAWLILAAVVGG